MYTYWLILVGSVIAECTTRSWPGWLVAKLLAGWGVGGVQSTVPTYISEVAPSRIRGGLLMAYSLWWTLGSFFAQVALQHISRSAPTNYLLPIYTQWAQLGLMLIIYIAVPETPLWCISVGKMEMAKKMLRRLHRGIENYDVDHQTHVLTMALEHERALAIEQRREKWYAIFRGTDGLRTVISLWTNLSQQFIGLTLFGTFGTYFFQQDGMSDPFKIKVITSSIQIGTVLVLVTVVDWMGRRLLACGGTTLSWLSCVAIGIVGVVPQAETYSYYLHVSGVSDLFPSNMHKTYGIRRRIGRQRGNRLGIYRRDILATTTPLYRRVWSCDNLRRRSCDECSGSLHDQCE